MNTAVLDKIASYFDYKYNERQLYNMIRFNGEYYELKVFGETITFNIEGERL